MRCDSKTALLHWGVWWTPVAMSTVRWLIQIMPFSPIMYATSSAVATVANKVILGGGNAPHPLMLMAVQSSFCALWLIVAHYMEVIKLSPLRSSAKRTREVLSATLVPSALFVACLLISLPSLYRIDVSLFGALRRTAPGFVLAVGTVEALCGIGSMPTTSQKRVIAIIITCIGATLAAIGTAELHVGGVFGVAMCNIIQALQLSRMKEVSRRLTLNSLESLFINSVHTVWMSLLLYVITWSWGGMPSFEIWWALRSLQKCLYSSVLVLLVNAFSFRTTLVYSPLVLTMSGQTKGVAEASLSLLLIEGLPSTFTTVGLLLGFGGSILFAYAGLESMRDKDQTKEPPPRRKRGGMEV